MNSSTKMRQELLEIPVAVERHIRETTLEMKLAANKIKERNPDYFISVARGSSDHAATYFKYICELMLGLPVASVGPSIASVYQAKLRLKNAVCLSISQSGQSPDVVSLTSSAKKQGTFSVAITNDPNSPLAGTANVAIPMVAGPELSVASTKTFVVSMVAGLHLVALIKEDQNLIRFIHQLPECLYDSVQTDWSVLLETLANKNGLYVLGRGTSFAVANESALKFKETCRMQAASYSSAEVLHGPVEIVNKNFLVLGLVSRDATESSIVEVCEQLSKIGADVFATSNNLKLSKQLTFIPTPHPLMDPISIITSFYSFVEKLAVLRGFNPDQPSHISKVTATI